MIKAIIIDDEPLAHDVLIHHLKQHNDVQVTNHFESGAEALAWLANNKTDLMFLDINMPLITGIELLKVLANRPQVIIVSAYQEFAITGFELDVADYLLKPVARERLQVGLNKVRTRLVDKTPEKSYIVAKVDREKRRFELNSISHIEAYGNYVKLWQNSTMSLVSSSLKHIKDQLPLDQFTQIHKSYIVGNAFVNAVDHESVTLSTSVQLKIGKSFKNQLNKIF